MFIIKSHLISLFSFFAPAQPLTVQPFAQPVDRPLILKHIEVLSELKKEFAKKNPLKLPDYTDKTPTLAYLKEAPNVLSEWHKAELETRKTKYATFIAPIIQNEKKYCNDYYVFYHGQLSAFRIFQDFLKELYTAINIHQPIDEFEFMRMWHLAEKELIAQSFIDKEEGEQLGTKWWADSRADLMKNMMCVNLSLFGNMWWCGESSFYYFMNNSSAFVTESLISKLFTELFDFYGFSPKYIDELVALNKLIATKEGNLMQILVPKEKVDDYVYLSQPGGTPYRTKIDSTFDKHKNRHIKISTILDQYIKDPSVLKDFDQYQARVLLSKDCMLNPDSGVKIFRYTTVNDSEMGKYKKELKQITNKIFTQALGQKTIKNLTNTGLGKLLELLKDRSI